MRVYGIFRLPPFSAPKLRAVKKERKHYHCDWSVVAEPGAGVSLTSPPGRCRPTAPAMRLLRDLM